MLWAALIDIEGFKATVCFPKYVQETDRGQPCLQQVFAQ